MKREKIEYHLKSAVDSLTPNVLDRIDLTTPQDEAPVWQEKLVDHAESRTVSFGKRFRAWGIAAAACICIVLAGNGGYNVYLNQKTDAVIGIDVNPSVEISINRKNKVLAVTPLNEEAAEILAEMDLEGVDLNVAVNAIIGGLVTHGYLDDLDNAILVTVTNDSISKADLLRHEVVEDIEKSLEENQVEAVVYDQQVVEKDETKKLAEEYGISYGKAYFLQELIEQNSSLGLTMDDMEELAPLTMEQIAERITESAYALGERTQKKETSAAETTTVPPTDESSEEETTLPSETSQENTEATTAPTVPVTEAPTTEPETEVEEEAENRVKIDYVDFEGHTLTVYFTSNVKWKDATVSIRGEDGESYSAMIEETHSDYCEVSVKGLEGGKTYRFSLGGIRQKQGGKPMSVSGKFEVPMISEEATEESETEPTTEAATEESTEKSTEDMTEPTRSQESSEAGSSEAAEPSKEETESSEKEETGETKEEKETKETKEQASFDQPENSIPESSNQEAG